MRVSKFANVEETAWSSVILNNLRLLPSMLSSTRQPDTTNMGRLCRLCARRRLPCWARDFSISSITISPLPSWSTVSKSERIPGSICLKVNKLNKFSQLSLPELVTPISTNLRKRSIAHVEPLRSDHANFRLQLPVLPSMLQRPLDQDRSHQVPRSALLSGGVSAVLKQFRVIRLASTRQSMRHALNHRSVLAAPKQAGKGLPAWFLDYSGKTLRTPRELVHSCRLWRLTAASLEDPSAPCLHKTVSHSIAAWDDAAVAHRRRHTYVHVVTCLPTHPKDHPDQAHKT